MRADDTWSEYVKEHLHYNPHTGDLHWLIPKRGRVLSKPAQTGGPDGYFVVDLVEISSRKKVGAHRVAWFLYYGYWPKDQLDHIDMDKRNNKISNLREANHKQNQGNIRKKNNSTSIYKGVRFKSDRNKWQARCASKHLGYFKSEQEAALAYNKFAKEYFGDFAKLNEV